MTGNELPQPPWVTRRQPAAKRAGKTPLSRAAIVETALKVLVNEGADALTMRRVAHELGTGPASLYAHVANLRELEDLVFDRVAAELSVPQPDPARWQEQLQDLMYESVQLMRRHPGVSRYALGRVPFGPNALAFSDGVLGLLHAGGVPNQAAAWAMDMIGLFISAAGFESDIARAEGRTEADVEQWAQQFGGYLASLPPERFPNVVRVAQELWTGTEDERLRFGIEMLVRGLAAMR
jgi:AcrR family transcriptional regulator